jgi:hypothetical protein
MSDARGLPQDYPPAEHVLRDLRLWSDPGAEPPCAGLPVQAAIHGASLPPVERALRAPAFAISARRPACFAAPANAGSPPR